MLASLASTDKQHLFGIAGNLEAFIKCFSSLLDYIFCRVRTICLFFYLQWNVRQRQFKVDNYFLIALYYLAGVCLCIYSGRLKYLMGLPVCTWLIFILEVRFSCFLLRNFMSVDQIVHSGYGLQAGCNRSKQATLGTLGTGFPHSVEYYY